MKRIATTNAPAALGPYAQAVDAGDTVYCSGQLGLDPATGALAEGVQAQTHQALKNLQAVLQEAGLTLDNVVKTTVFVQDLGDFGTVNEIYGAYFHGASPRAAACRSPRCRRERSSRSSALRCGNSALTRKSALQGRIPCPPGDASAAADGAGAYRMRPYGGSVRGNRKWETRICRERS